LKFYGCHTHRWP